jgi:hypothetical protein
MGCPFLLNSPDMDAKSYGVGVESDFGVIVTKNSLRQREPSFALV